MVYQTLTPQFVPVVAAVADDAAVADAAVAAVDTAAVDLVATNADDSSPDLSEYLLIYFRSSRSTEQHL